jgi:hypothetical protein
LASVLKKLSTPLLITSIVTHCPTH